MPAHRLKAKLRAQAAVARPRVTEIRRGLAQADREITNYTRAIAGGDFASLEAALRAAEQRRTSLQTELALLNGNPQSAVVQLTPAAEERHLQGMAEKLRSGVHKKVREAIQQSVARILVGMEGGLMIEAKPGGLLGLNGIVTQSGCEEGWALIEANPLSAANRRWRVIFA